MARKPITLKNVLIFPFIILITFAVLSTSYLTWKINTETTSVLGEQISKQSALRMEEQLDYYLKHAETFNQSLIDPINHRLIDVQNQDTVLNYIEYIVTQNPTLATLSYAYPDGSYMGISNTDTGDLLKKIASPETDRVFSTYNMTQQKTVQQKPDYDARLRPWFIKAYANDHPIWSPVFEMYSNGKLGVTYAEALYDTEDVFIGVVGTDIIFDDLNEQLHRIRLTDNSYLFILDEEGHVIAQSDLTETHGNSSLYTYHGSDNALLKQAVNFIYTQEDFDRTPIHSSCSFTIADQTADYFVNSIPYGFDNGLNWHIGVVIPKSDFLGQVEKVSRNTFYIWLISFLLCIIIGLALTYLINKAIHKLRSNVERVEQTGSLYEHDNSHNIKEVSDLSLAFSLMSRRLHESYLDVQVSNEVLEEIISKRTDSLEEANRQLQEQSNTDSLTNLANRRSFDYFLQFYWDALENNELEYITLIICDLDFFKQYNDVYGHIKGDETLAQFATVVKQAARDKDTTARYGGEEFVIIMPDATIDDAVTVANRIFQHLAALKIPHKKSEISDYLTTSIGIASTINRSMKDKHELINRADIALYFAKKEGRNQYVIYSEQEDDDIQKYRDRVTL